MAGYTEESASMSYLVQPALSIADGRSRTKGRGPMDRVPSVLPFHVRMTT